MCYWEQDTRSEGDLFVHGNSKPESLNSFFRILLYMPLFDREPLSRRNRQEYKSCRKWKSRNNTKARHLIESAF